MTRLDEIQERLANGYRRSHETFGVVLDLEQIWQDISYLLSLLGIVKLKGE